MNGKRAKQMRKLALEHFDIKHVKKEALNPIKNFIRYIKDKYSDGTIKKSSCVL